MKKLAILLLLLVIAMGCSNREANQVEDRLPTQSTTTSPDEAASTPVESVTQATATPINMATVDEVLNDVNIAPPTPTDANLSTQEIVEPDAASAEPANPITFQLDAWADNWFAAYLGEELIIEDSVSITTERSFNAETVTFEASYPLNLNFILKDFKENDTGLEYIGSSRQQMGDGGFIMQLIDTGSGDVVAVSNADWACTVIHEAPLDKSCEAESNPVAGTAPCDFTDLGEPEGWKLADFDDSEWIDTTIHSANDVRPKDGYDQISWEASAEFIWGPDLETNNTVLCRVQVDAPFSNN